MTYLSDVADEIRAELPPDSIPADAAEELMLLYAVLCLAVGSEVTAANVHDAWTAWMAARGQEHESMVPFNELPPDVQSEDEPFASAIRRVANRLGAAGFSRTSVRFARVDWSATAAPVWEVPMSVRPLS